MFEDQIQNPLLDCLNILRKVNKNFLGSAKRMLELAGRPVHFFSVYFSSNFDI